MNLDRNKIIKFIERNLSYDGDPDDKCPKCHFVIRKGRSWLYHHSSMIGNLCLEMEWPRLVEDKLKEMVYELNQDCEITGNKTEDAIVIANSIIETIGAR